MSHVNDTNDKTKRILASTHKDASTSSDNDTTTNVVYLADIARSEGRSPKSVRARFRRMYETRTDRTEKTSDVRATHNLPRVIDRKRWAFAATDETRVRELVINDTRVIDDATDKAA